MVGFLTGSLGDFLDRHYDSEKVKTLILANNVYGKHGGPYAPGSALGLLFHLLSGGEHEVQGFYGHVMGGMGAITQAMAAACRERGVEIRTGAAVARILARGGRPGVALEDGARDRGPAGAVERRSEADVPRPGRAGRPAGGFPAGRGGIKMDGPCAKVNMVLAEEPRVPGMPPGATAAERALFTLVPSLEFAERCYDQAKLGRAARRAVGGLCRRLQRGPEPGAARPARPGLLRAVRPVSPARGELGRAARAAGRPGREDDRRVRPQRARLRSWRGRC